MRVDSRFSTLKVKKFELIFSLKDFNTKHSRNFDILKYFADPRECYAIVLKELNKQFAFIQHLNLFYPLAFLNWETVVDLTHIPSSRSMPTTRNKSEEELIKSFPS
jgi:hypothetical protein